MTRKWKRSDISQRVVLEVFSRPFSEDSWRHHSLMRETGAPEKVIWAAMERELGNDFIDYGTNLKGGWLTPQGKERLAQLRTTDAMSDR